MIKRDLGSVAWTGDGNTWTADLSDYVKDISHAAPDAASMRLTGLEQSTFTLTGTFDNSEGFWPAPAQQPVRVSCEVPDGRWQAFKWRLKQRRWLSWIPVRMTTWSWTGRMEPWRETAGTFTTKMTGVNKVEKGARLR